MGRVKWFEIVLLIIDYEIFIKVVAGVKWRVQAVGLAKPSIELPRGHNSRQVLSVPDARERPKCCVAWVRDAHTPP